MISRVTNAAMTPEERICQTLSVEVRQTGADPSLFLDALHAAISGEVWKSLGAGSFREFVTGPFPMGMGSSVENVRLLVQMTHRHEAHDAETRDRMNGLRADALRLLAEPSGPGQGARTDLHNIPSNRREVEEQQYGTTAGYALRLLANQFPELYGEVQAGRMSPHKAAVQAGIRKKTVTVEAGAFGFARYIRKHFTRDQIEDLISALREN